MTSYSQIARPYARAAFECALEDKALAQWSATLELLSDLSKVADFARFIALPEVGSKEMVDLVFEAVGSQLDENAKNLVRLLAHNDRLNALSAVKACFDKLKEEHEKAINAEVVSFAPMSKDQKDKLIASLKNKLQRDVTLSERVDKSLLGGAVVHAGDLVIDGSVRGKLKKLEVELQA